MANDHALRMGESIRVHATAYLSFTENEETTTKAVFRKTHEHNNGERHGLGANLRR